MITPPKITPFVKYYSILCLVFFLIQSVSDYFFSTSLIQYFGLWGTASGFRPWQLLTFPFFHSDLTNVLFNLMLLVFIGSELEGIWGPRRFLQYCAFCASFAAGVYLIVAFGASGLPALIGSSGLLYGLLLAYGIIFSERELLFMLLFPVKAKYFVLLLVGIELYVTVFSRGQGISSMVHLSGIFAGFLYLVVATYFKKRRLSQDAGSPRSEKRSHSNKSHLKLVVNRDTPSEAIKDKSGGPKGGPTWH